LEDNPEPFHFLRVSKDHPTLGDLRKPLVSSAPSSSGLEAKTAIRDLKRGMKGVRAGGKVQSVKKDLRSAYTPHALAVIRDRTGSIPLNLWRGQISQVRIGDAVLVKEGFVRAWRGTLELSTWEEELTVSRQRKPKSSA
jgi:ssDNA-binding replication factor A large subunit